MPFSSTAEQLLVSIACCKEDGASPTAQPRVAFVDAFQLRVYFSVLTDEVEMSESGLDEALDSVDNFITTVEILRKLKDSTDTTTSRRKRELLLDNADRLISKLQLHHAITKSRNPSHLSRSINSSTKPSVSLNLFARPSSRIGAKF